MKKNGYGVQFNIPLKQLRQSISPEIHYVFMIRHQHKWVNTMIIERTELYGMFRNLKIGTVAADRLMLYVSFQDKTVTCSKVDFSPFIDNFSGFPEIIH